MPVDTNALGITRKKKQQLNTQNRPNPPVADPALMSTPKTQSLPSDVKKSSPINPQPNSPVVMRDDKGNISGITTADGKTFSTAGVGKSGIRDLISNEQEKMQTPQGFVEQNQLIALQRQQEQANKFNASFSQSQAQRPLTEPFNETLDEEIGKGILRSAGNAAKISLFGANIDPFARKRAQLNAEDAGKFNSIRRSAQAINTDIAMIRARAPGWEQAFEDYQQQIESIIIKRNELKQDTDKDLEIFLGTDNIDEMVKIDNFLTLVVPGLDLKMQQALNSPDFVLDPDPSVQASLEGLEGLGEETQ